MSIILNAKGIYKNYKQGSTVIEVLKNLDFQVEKGELVSIIGKSGSGKSTFLHILSGLDKPDKGSIHIKETSIYDLD